METSTRRPLGPSVAFNMNYFRPHTFALEAEPEVAAFLARAVESSWLSRLVPSLGT